MHIDDDDEMVRIGMQRALSPVNRISPGKEDLFNTLQIKR